MQKTQKRRWRWLGVLVLVALVAAAIVYFPRGLRGPESVAREYLDALARAPQDLPALRTAGHLADNDDPLAPIEGLSTRVALEFLYARTRLGAAPRISVVESRRPAPLRYAVVLEVSDPDDRAAPPRRFAVNLQQNDDGDWRVGALSVVE